jgi:LysR family glycine cleavage system transcriptional activator
MAVPGIFAVWRDGTVFCEQECSFSALRAPHPGSYALHHPYRRRCLPMRTILPSTTALRVFEAASRHLTCTGAADELFMTQGAVSKQLRNLEDSLGAALFVRANRGLVLTEGGRVYLERIKPLLLQLAQASEALVAQTSTMCTLKLRVGPIIGDRWLMTRFPAFARAYPNIDLQFASLQWRDRPEESFECDALIRGWEGALPSGYVYDYLFGREMLLVAAPHLLECEGGLESLQDLRRYRLFDHFSAANAWSRLFHQYGIEPVTGQHMLRYEHYATLLKAAVSGQGVALVPEVWARDEIGRGELVNPMGCVLFDSSAGYYFAVPEDQPRNWGVAALRGWLIEEAAATRASLQFARAAEERAAAMR